MLTPRRENDRRSRVWLLRALAACCLTLALMLLARPARAQLADMPPELERIGVKERLDRPMPLDGQWRNQDQKPLRLGDIVRGERPAIFVFAYHSCPTLCSMVLKATSRAIQNQSWTVGKDFDVIVASIDPNDNLDFLRKRREVMIADYNRPGSESGFHFLYGDQASIDAALAAAGVEVEYDANQKQWGHPAVITLLKPNGEIARYLYGLEYSANDVKVGLLEASNGKSISTIEQVILYCYQFDPNGGRYVLVAWRVMRIGGGLIALLLIGSLASLWLRERRRSRASQRDSSSDDVSEGADSPSHSHS